MGIFWGTGLGVVDVGLHELLASEPVVIVRQVRVHDERIRVRELRALRGRIVGAEWHSHAPTLPVAAVDAEVDVVPLCEAVLEQPVPAERDCCLIAEQLNSTSTALYAAKLESEQTMGSPESS